MIFLSKFSRKINFRGRCLFIPVSMYSTLPHTCPWVMCAPGWA